MYLIIYLLIYVYVLMRLFTCVFVYNHSLFINRMGVSELSLTCNFQVSISINGTCVVTNLVVIMLHFKS